MKFIASFFAFCLLSTLVFSQERLKVFVDCDCNLDYIKTNCTCVDFVKNRTDADVHIMRTAQYNESGAPNVRLSFLGQKKYDHKTDSISYDLPKGVTELDSREKFLHYLMAGLMPFIAKSGFLNEVTVEMKADSGQHIKQTLSKDPWHAWIIELNGNGNFNGSEAYGNSNLNANISAVQETPKVKNILWMHTDLQRQRVTSDGVSTIYPFQNYEAGIFLSKRLKDHWAIGSEYNLANSLFSNFRLRSTYKPSFEISFFKYEDYNSKRLNFLFEPSISYNSYYDTTIYFKTEEWVLGQNLSLIGSSTQKWGSVNAGIFWRNLYTDFSKNSLSFMGSVSLKVANGININFFGQYEFVRNQINLRKENATLADILVKNRELRSAYNYMMGVGLSYTFGSKTNNVINPIYKGLNISMNM